MNPTTIDKKAAITWLIVIVGSFAAFKLTFPKKRKSLKAGAIEMTELQPNDREFINPPTMDESAVGNNNSSESAFIALKAYIAAYNAQEPQSELDKLNGEIAKDYGLKVIRRRTDNKLVVQDLSGNDVMVYNG